MNHRRRRTVLRDACFSQEALDAFNLGGVYLRAAQNGLARATEQYVKDIRVRKFWSNIYIYIYIYIYASSPRDLKRLEQLI